MTKKLHWWRHFSVFADVNTNDFCSVKYTWVTWGKSWRHQSTSFVLGYAWCQFQTLQFGVSFSCFFLQAASGIMKTKLREGLSFCDKLPWWGGYFSPPSPSLLKHLCNSRFNQNISLKLGHAALNLVPEILLQSTIPHVRSDLTSLNLLQLYLNFTDHLSHFGELFKNLTWKHFRRKNPSMIWIALCRLFHFCDLNVFRIWSENLYICHVTKSRS